MKFRKFLSLLLTVILMLSFVACSSEKPSQAPNQESTPSASTDASSNDQTADKPLKIGLAMNTLTTNAAFIDAHTKIKERLDARGDELIAVDLMGDPNLLAKSIENFIAADCDVVIVMANNLEQLTPYLPTIKEKGIIFGSYDVVAEDAVYNLLSDNYELGKIIGREGGNWLKKHFDGKGEAAVLSADTHAEIKKRGDGIVDGFLEVCPDAKIVQRYGSASNPEKGLIAGENLLQSNPDVKVVMGINDGGILGVYEAFKAAGLNDASNNLGLFGCDGSGDGLNAIREGGIYRATVSLDIANEIADFVDRCAEAARTNKIDESMKIKYFPMTPIYLDNIGDVE